MSINERIRIVRKTLKMTQVQFGLSIRLAGSYIADMENNHRQVNDRIIHLIALTYGVSEEWLKEGTGDMFIKSPEDKAKRIIQLFDNLRPEFQDFALKQLDQLLELQKFESN